MSNFWIKRSLRALLAMLLAGLVAVTVTPAAVSQSAGPAETASETIDMLIDPEDQPAAESADSEVDRDAPADVKLDGRVLFVIRENAALASPQERAEAVTEKLQAFARDRSRIVESLQVSEQDGRTVISAGEPAPESIILAISEADAELADTTPAELSQVYLERMQAAVARYRRERSAGSLVTAAAYTAIATVVLIGFALVLAYGLPAFYRQIKAWEGTRIPAIRIRSLQILSARRVADLAIAILKIAQVAVTIVSIFVYVTLCLSFFPWSRSLALAIKSYLFDSLKGVGENFVSYLPNLLSIALIGLVTYYINKFANSIFSEIEKGTISIPGFYREWAKPTYRLVEIFVFIVAAVIMFPYLPGFGSPAFQGLSIFIGILLSLGSTTAVSNAVAGIILIYTRAFQVGDRVQIAEVEGTIDEKLFLVTRLRTPYNVIVTLPNALLLTGKIINYNATIRDSRIPLILTVMVTLGYDVPWQQVHATLIEAALETEHILAEPAPFVLQKDLGDFSVAYELNAYTRYPTRMERIHSDLRQNIQDKCNSAGIEILSPRYSAVRDGNTSTIPENYLPEDYAAPGFQLNPLGNLFQIDFKMGATSKPTNGSASSQRDDRSDE